MAISRVRVATAAYMLLSAPNTAPMPMMRPMALPSAVIRRVRLADCSVKYSRVVLTSTLRRGSVVSAALKASKAPASVSLTVTEVALLAAPIGRPDHVEVAPQVRVVGVVRLELADHAARAGR